MGKDNGGGNPNHDPNTGRFISGSGIDRDPNMKRNIDNNGEGAKRAADQEKNRFKVVEKNYSPKNLIGSGENERYSKNAKYHIDDFYTATKRFLESPEGKDKLKELLDLDMNNEIAVTEFASKLFEGVDSERAFDNMACHNCAGIMAYLFERRKIDYECCVGYTHREGQVNISHTWIRALNKTYEKFPSNAQYKVVFIHDAVTHKIKPEDKK